MDDEGPHPSALPVLTDAAHDSCVRERVCVRVCVCLSACA